MTPDRVDHLKKEMEKLTKKFGLTDCAFCGVEPKTGEFLGFVIDKSITLETAWNVTLNVGRLWQHMRTIIRDTLNKFDKEGWR